MELYMETDKEARKKRICIYLTYDKQNIVDQYIGYALKQLKTCVSHLVVVCNEKKIISGMEILEEYADEIFLRENIGYDAGGFKDALCSYLGWDKVLQYDELVLVNDSMFGPFEEMEDIFTKMDTKRADFWGLIKFGESMMEGEVIPEHIQTFFCVIRSVMLHDAKFRRYWEEMPYYETFGAVVRYHEIRFTSYFKELGYRYDTLADTKINDSRNLANNYLQYGTICYELLKKRNFPFLKKQQISYDTLNLQTQENLRQAIDYIAGNTDYDAGLIWQNIIRTMDSSDLQKNLHLRYIIDNPCRKAISETLALAVFVRYAGSIGYLTEYLEEAKVLCRIYVYSSDENILEEYKKLGYAKCSYMTEKSNQEIFKEVCRYDYVGIINDADMSSEVRPSCTNKSYFYNIWENLIKDKTHIQTIAGLFESEEYLGFLAPPKANFAHYFGRFGKGWDGRYEEINTSVKRLNLQCQISYDKPPFTASENFWIRGSILRNLLTRQPVKYEELAYMWIYIVQDAGYYSGVVESTDYAGLDEANLSFYLETITADVRKYFGSFDTFLDFRKVMIHSAVEDFCRKYRHIYIYGAGYLARQYQDLILGAEGFVVSDGQDKPDTLMGSNVLYLSEIRADDDTGIVVCLNPANQMQVIPILERKGLTNYFCI